ncbi:ABC transporter substrate-binding protein [Rhodoplanes sp. TEM]|uniref:ABC transporter substrate-binding protein n=1 Tax=Rhodoplanes tepidamans TaxID=200616 RepID=A0ABT5JJ29_RHOTP|nr:MULTISPECIES: ABC transporter substrate-binding protein [Rhodoplanes]MDC7789532.1 ABC transporter substrate-binding protein [Rhodoplanes tepidamans]MDC7987728.1 ABC transporter substrate-binding protein [Rhodoplanes sp. TEM]
MLAAVTAAAAVVASLAPAAAEAPKRIASLNLCTDQLLLALADPEQIVGLSPFARDPVLSWTAAQAERFPVLSGGAEDAMMLKPDLVVAGRFERRATRELLARRGLPLADFDIVRSIDEAKQQIARMGALVGHPERAVAHIAAIDAALARLRAAASRSGLRVLAVSRRGWVPGADSLTSSLLAAAGLVNAASELGIATGGFASLEEIVATKPDLVLVASAQETAEDQGQAFLLHPALQRLYPPERRIVVPEMLTVCGGPMLAEALDRLAAALTRAAP